MNTLCRVNSTISDFRFGDRVYEKIPVNWFVKSRPTPIMPYEDGIQGYNQKEDTSFEENSLNEHFLFSEALAFSSYLFEVRNLKSHIIEAALPIPSCSLTIYDIDDLEPGKDFIKLSESKDYKLPFAVWGCFDLAGTTWRDPDEDVQDPKQLDEWQDLYIGLQDYSKAQRIAERMRERESVAEQMAYLERRDREILLQEGKTKREKCVQFLIDNGYDLEFVNELISKRVQTPYIIQNNHVVENGFSLF